MMGIAQAWRRCAGALLLTGLAAGPAWAAGCDDPLVLDQMRRESLFTAPASGAPPVRIVDPEQVGAGDGVLRCRAEWRVEAPLARLVPVFEYGYAFTLPAARRAFNAAAGLSGARLERAGDYLRRRAAAEDAAHDMVRLSAPVAYRVTRQPRPFLLDWQFASPDVAAQAGRAFAAGLAAARERERAATLARARALGFDSIRAMEAAEAAARAARERLSEATALRNAAADRLDTLQREREAVREQLRKTGSKVARLTRELEAHEADSNEWVQRIKRESFTHDNALVELSDTRVYTGQSPYGTPEQVVQTTIVNFSDQTFYAADLHVVIWHTAVQQFFEDRSLPVGLGQNGLSPGESEELHISLNGRPGFTGLAFTGKAFRTPGERHAFLFVNALKNARGQPLFRAAWRRPGEAREAQAQTLATLRGMQDALQARLQRLDQRIAAQEKTLADAEATVEQRRASLPPLPSEMESGG